ncbi:hypothetical protein [Paenibacillus sp. FSL H8-0332]|uniref:hypothetical protein n=1 Tax=Paenibacillus sp. FSL H8-0332 TaxID=2954742 RepID=UPI0030D0B70E
MDGVSVVFPTISYNCILSAKLDVKIPTKNIRRAPSLSSNGYAVIFKNGKVVSA